jgi:cellulose biosynthesis protein BcsQ
MSDRQDLEAQLRANLDRAGLTATEIRVLRDDYSGWRIAVVSPDFDGMSNEERRQTALAGLEHVKIQWLDLLTPEELQWAGSLPAEIEPEQLPLWPESLARAGRETGEALFPSSLEEDLDLPIVATFYSLRGGVGRSTALAYTAWVLADHGKKVVCADLDLEAPGLAALFDKESEIGEDQGIVDLLISIDQGNEPDVSKHLIRVSEKHELYCLPAGIPDADYARKLSFIDPEAWYREERNPLRELLELIGKKLPFKPDVVLLDSRTGITRLSGPLLFDLADLAFIVFFPHPQTRKGTEGLVRALLASRTRRSTPERPLAPEPRFVVSPIPAPRVLDVGLKYRRRAEEWIASWLDDSNHSDRHKFAISEIMHLIPYQEELAVSDRIFAERERWLVYAPLAEWIERFLPTAAEKQAPPIVSDRKNAILRELDFSTGTAEHQEDLLDTFVETAVISRALQTDVPLVIGRKGTGKTAIFRFLMESSNAMSCVILAPTKLRDSKSWQIGPSGFKEVDAFLTRNKIGWREFWTAYTCLACHVQLPEDDIFVPDALSEALQTLPRNEMEVIEVLERLLCMRKGPLLLDAWLQQIDDVAKNAWLLLFDGLDSGFGSSPDDRDRRTRAVAGLLSLVVDRGDALKQLRFKIMLREDIWRQLRFENKSHLYGRSVTLNWDAQSDYLTVVLRQALRSPSFRALLDPSDADRVTGKTARDAEAVYRAWNVLAGERMKGENTAYTANWVWKRLGDANGDHSPRILLQMFASATEQERREHEHTPYDRSILRPRVLRNSLATVSEHAISALLDEEFAELKPLCERLAELGRTPVHAQDLADLVNEVALAREVGLLAVHEGTASDPILYRVPDIYRLGLGMTRMGQP